MKIERSD